jgi:murein L,D-transpeptidase YafK
MPLRPSWQITLLFVITPIIGGGCWWLVKDGNPPHYVFSVADTQSSIAGHSSPAVHPHEILAEAESTLLKATDALIQARLEEAEILLRETLRKEPHFRVAHALLGDIQRVRAGMPPELQQNTEQDASLGPIWEEWKRRLQAPSMVPATDAWPDGLISFSPTSPHAFVVDANALRLYWLRKGDRPQDPPKIVASFYISVGKAGVGKQVEGDNKTPLGVYRIVQLRPARELPAFYGTGALVLDYPHGVDRLLKRTGSGIWLHGSPPDTYTRDPLASEGCVVLSNSDMQQLMQLDDVLDSPVLITTKLEWIPSSQHQKKRSEAIAIVRTWARQNVGLELNPEAIGIQRWSERDGNWYWRVEYRGTNLDGERYTWFFREQEDGLIHVAGKLPPQPTQENSDVVVASAAINSPSAPTSHRASSSQGSNAEQEIRKTIQSWAHAWAKRDLDSYFSYYQPNFSSKGLSNSEWRQQRRERILGRRRLRVEIVEPRIKIQENTATVTFIQRYQADDQPELRTRKTLQLQRIKGRWLIVEERTP